MLPGGEILTHQTLGTTLGKALQQQVDNPPLINTPANSSTDADRYQQSAHTLHLWPDQAK